MSVDAPAKIPPTENSTAKQQGREEDLLILYELTIGQISQRHERKKSTKKAENVKIFIFLS